MSICPQSELLQPCSRSADLDVLSELSRGVTLGQAAARRLQLLDRSWAAAATRAEETCRSAWGGGAAATSKGHDQVVKDRRQHKQNGCLRLLQL